MRNNKNIVIIAMCIAVFAMVVGYAAFNTILTISGTANIESNWKVVFTNIQKVAANTTSGASEVDTPLASGTSATFNVDLQSPGDKIEYQITVANQGSLNAVISSIDATETGSDALTFEVTNIKVGDKLAKQTSTTFNVIISYKDSVTSQPTITTNELTIKVNYAQDINQSITEQTPSIVATTLAGKILRDNVAQSDTNIDFSLTSEEDGTSGLYYTSTNTEDGKTTYYFRGDVKNNFVQFGAYPAGTTVNGTTYSVDTPIYWRIIRINEDGSIRMIYNGTSTSATGSATIIGNSTFNSSVDDNAYVGYMHGATGQSGDNAYNLTHANDNPSTIKGVIDNWYTNNTNLSSLRTDYLADAGFCNDRSVAPTAKTWATNDTALGYAKNLTYYGAYNRLQNLYQPQFVCPNANNDLFTTSESSKGNKALSNPIGLISADELSYAGGVYSKANNSYYLYTGDFYWTMSPPLISGNGANVWMVRDDGSLRSILGYNNRGVRPVINLASTVELSDGLPSGCTGLDGTAACPYIIK